MVPYLYNSGNDALDSLVSHVYQQSVADVLVKALSIEESNFSLEMADVISKRKISVITKLVNRLEDTEDDECFNVASVLSELIQTSDHFSLLARKPTI